MTSFTPERGDWRGEDLLVRRHEKPAAWIIVARHSSVAGPPTGGTRLKEYAHPQAAVDDALRLSEGMTLKWAGLRLPRGGGKAVLAPDAPLNPEERRALLQSYATLLEELDGTFQTGRDLGTTDDDMRVLAAITSHVHGIDIATGSARDPGPYTARGVLAAVAATARHMKVESLAGCSVVVQGAGDVGLPLVRSLLAQGARVQAADPHPGRAAGAAAAGAALIQPQEALTTSCDLLAPCATGGILNRNTIPALRCRAVCGSANNQLGTPDDADRLAARGIVYAPDFIVNGGAALAFARIHMGLTDEGALAGLVDGIGSRVTEILETAGKTGRTPHAVAEAQARDWLASLGASAGR